MQSTTNHSSVTPSLYLQQIEDSTWDAFVTTHPAAHLLQSHGWGALKGRFEWDTERVALTNIDGSIQAGALLLLRKIGWKGIGIKLGYVPKGPLVNWQDRAETRAVFEEIEAVCRRRGAAILKIEPDLPDSATNRALLQSYGFRPSLQTVQPRSSTIIDISDSEEAILARMKQKWRYNVRLSEKKGITVRPATPADLPVFNQLMATTGDRDGFSVHSADYYDLAYRLFVPNQAVYLLAEFEGTPIAAIVVTCVGKTGIYLWGASGDKERNRMPNHGLQWAGIRWAKALGATHYDFWGIPDEIGQIAAGMRNGDGSGTPVEALPIDLESLPSHGLWGVYRFKQGFNGNVVRWVGAWDRPVSSFGFALYTTGLAVRAVMQETSRQVDRQTSRSGDTPASPPLPLSFSPGLRAIRDAQDWRATLATLPNPHVLQSWEWGQVKGQTEWTAERYALVDSDKKPLAAFQFLWRQPIAYLPLRVAYVPKGPVVDWNNSLVVKETLRQIIALAQRRLCLFVKIDPDLREDGEAGRSLLAILRNDMWRFSADQIQFKNTGFSDLVGGEETLLEGMKQKWRYNVRLAEKRGIRIRQAGADDLRAFYDLYAETSQRDGFLIRPFDYYRTTWQRFLDAQSQLGNPAGGVLLLAEHVEETLPIAGVFLMRHFNSTVYLNGASSERRRRDMPNYLLQWEAMRWALAQGCTIYDWWGAPTNIDDLDDSMQGVWQFKQGFGAEFQAHIGAWDYPVSQVGYKLYAQVMPRVLAWMKRG